MIGRCYHCGLRCGKYKNRRQWQVCTHMRPAAPQATGMKMCILRSLARFASLAFTTMDAAATAKGIADRRATCANAD